MLPCPRAGTERHRQQNAHNHPSGDVTPSAEDVVITQRIVEASALLGLQVLDHLIVSDERHYSFLDAGQLGAR